MPVDEELRVHGYGKELDTWNAHCKRQMGTLQMAALQEGSSDIQQHNGPGKKALKAFGAGAGQKHHTIPAKPKAPYVPTSEQRNALKAFGAGAAQEHHAAPVKKTTAQPVVQAVEQPGDAPDAPAPARPKPAQPVKEDHSTSILEGMRKRADGTWVRHASKHPEKKPAARLAKELAKKSNLGSVRAQAPNPDPAQTAAVDKQTREALHDTDALQTQLKKQQPYTAKETEVPTVEKMQEQEQKQHVSQ